MNITFEKLICSTTDSCKLLLFRDSGIIILHNITAGIYNSETAGAYLTPSIKPIVVEMSDTPLEQIFRRQDGTMCYIMTPAAAASQWEIVLMFSITATLPLHQDPTNISWQLNMWWCTPEVRIHLYNLTVRVTCFTHGIKERKKRKKKKHFIYLPFVAKQAWTVRDKLHFPLHVCLI